MSYRHYAPVYIIHLVCMCGENNDNRDGFSSADVTFDIL